MLGTAVTSLAVGNPCCPCSGNSVAGTFATESNRSTTNRWGAALLTTLERGLGKDFTPPVREAWVICYTSIAREMMEGTGHGEALP